MICLVTVTCMIHGDYLFHPEDKGYTWCKKNPFVARRLGYILTNSMLFDKTTECNIHSVTSTDHRGCSVLIKFAEIERGPGYWKFNNSLLKGLVYVNQINTLIDNHAAGLENKSDYQIERELLKVKIRDFTRSYSKQKSIHNKNTLLKLYSELNDSDSTLAANPACVAAQSKRDQIKMEIELFEQQKSRAAQVRARVKWVEEGEKNTKYFF